mmetsp:Transcript_75584/g.190120  ORF Transcript_75584/g.190120 Transcript_75584/m.190120 type:complete len:242 (+) Transcript_75584:973-1698(+)
MQPSRARLPTPTLPGHHAQPQCGRATRPAPSQMLGAATQAKTSLQTWSKAVAQLVPRGLQSQPPLHILLSPRLAFGPPRLPTHQPVLSVRPLRSGAPTSQHFEHRLVASRGGRLCDPAAGTGPAIPSSLWRASPAAPRPPPSQRGVPWQAPHAPFGVSHAGLRFPWCQRHFSASPPCGARPRPGLECYQVCCQQSSCQKRHSYQQQARCVERQHCPRRLACQQDQSHWPGRRKCSAGPCSG